MMDWHYHKDDVPTKEEIDWESNVRAWQKAGFKVFHNAGSSGDSTLLCPKCGSLVTEKTWRKHLNSLHSRKTIDIKAPR